MIDAASTVERWANLLARRNALGSALVKGSDGAMALVGLARMRAPNPHLPPGSGHR